MIILTWLKASLRAIYNLIARILQITLPKLIQTLFQPSPNSNQNSQPSSSSRVAQAAVSKVEHAHSSALKRLPLWTTSRLWLIAGWAYWKANFLNLTSRTKRQIELPAPWPTSARLLPSTPNMHTFLCFRKREPSETTSNLRETPCASLRRTESQWSRSSKNYIVSKATLKILFTLQSVLLIGISQFLQLKAKRHQIWSSWPRSAYSWLPRCISIWTPASIWWSRDCLRSCASKSPAISSSCLKNRSSVPSTLIFSLMAPYPSWRGTREFLT